VLSFFNKPKPVQCFAFESGSLYLQSAQPLALQKTHSLEAALPVRQGQDGAPLTVKIKARVCASHELTALFEKRLQSCYGEALPHIYSAEVESPKEAIPHLEALLDPLPQPQELRAQPRAEKRLRATSPHLPGFRGTIMDLSMGGLGMLVDAPMDRGRRIEFEIDFEEQRSRRLALSGRICWCRPEPGAAYRIGIQFEALSEEKTRQLRHVVDKLLSAEPGVIVDNNFLRG
jgi:Tfp pilus assembly protein PilZ